MVVVVGVGRTKPACASAGRFWRLTPLVWDNSSQSPSRAPSAIVAALQSILHAAARDGFLLWKRWPWPERKPPLVQVVAISASVCCASRLSTCATVSVASANSSTLATAWLKQTGMGHWLARKVARVSLVSIVVQRAELQDAEPVEVELRGARDCVLLTLLIQKGSRPSVFTGMCTRRSIDRGL